MKEGPKIETVEDIIDFVYAEAISIPENIQFMDECKEDGMFALHHGYGTSLRNSLGCWDINSNVYKIFKKQLKIWHADDMSGIILTSIWRKHHNLPLKLEEQCQVYYKHWEKYGVPDEHK